MDGDSGEDVPNNFFDDFDKDEFMDGLKVIDSLHEKDEEYETKPQRNSASPSRIHKFTNPCSQRRDLEKTNAAILRDKEAKVKEHLAKHLESKDDIRPPGTELDDFFDKVRTSKKKKILLDRGREPELRSPALKKEEEPDSPRWESPKRYSHYGDPDDFHPSGRDMRKIYQSGSKHVNSYNPGYRHYNPRYSLRYSPHRSTRPISSKYSWHRSSPHRVRHSPQHDLWQRPRHSSRDSPKYSPPHRSRRSPHHGPRLSPRQSSSRHSHHSPRQSPWRKSRRDSHHSPSRSSRKHHSSYSPYSKRGGEKEHSPVRNVQWSPVRSPGYESTQNVHYNVQDSSQHFNQQPYNPDMSNMNTPYMYPPTGDYNSYLAPPAQPAVPLMPQGPPNMLINQMGPPDLPLSQPGAQIMPVPLPQPVPMPITPLLPAMMDQNIAQPNFIAPQVPMVPHPSTVSSVPPIAQPQLHGQNVKASYEALVQLVAEGTLSHEDFLKLAPNTKGSNNSLDAKTKKVVSRCNFAVQKMSKLQKANRIVIKKGQCSTETLCFPQKYASPLKRQVPIEFEVTTATQKNIHNKLLINNIIATIGLDKSVLGIPTAKDNMKSVGIQTTTPYCDMCEIRDSVKTCDVATSTDSAFFSNNVHTQVLEEDLLNSKAVFNPSGSVGDGGPISIAHLTPAQLVSQLAARAKSFQHSDSTSSQQFRRWNSNNDYDGRGGGHHFNQNNRYRF